MAEESGRQSGGQNDTDEPGIGPWDERSPDTLFGRTERGGESDTAGTGDDTISDDDGGNVAGEFVPDGPIEPGTPSLENALFVAVGAYVAVLGIARLVLGAEAFTLANLAAVTAVMAAISGITFAYFGVLTPDT